MMPPASRPLRIHYGADYNPEQWPRDVWLEDAALMQEAGVSLVSLGIFSWAFLEPVEGRYEFDWLDDVVDILSTHGIGIDLATATAATPPWLAARYPESLPVDATGHRLAFGSRQTWCPSSPVYREKASALVEQLGSRYGKHPALALWHVGNEYGCHNARCYCERSTERFREWLSDRYRTIDALNDAWSTAFWSQRYGDLDQIPAPGLTATFSNPCHVIDFRRFCSDELLASFIAERDILHNLSPGVPVTTNFMVGGAFEELDYWRWAPEVDVVSNDHYLNAADSQAHVGLALSADLTRGLAGGSPWILMEHSTSAVNWQARNRAKDPGELIRNSMQHVARGADGVLFFQWRQSRGGAEKFHSAMVPHGGTDTQVWREVVRLGADLAAAEELAGSTVSAEVAIVYDWQSAWALANPAHPSVDVKYRREVEAVYASLWRGGVTVDFVPPGGDLGDYRLVLAPCLHAVAPEEAANLERYVAGGGHLLLTYFSGIVDRDDRVLPGGYPGAFRSLLGLTVEEFYPLQDGEVVTLDDGSAATFWSEVVRPGDAEVLAGFASGPNRGGAAVTRHVVGDGVAWYVATSLRPDAWDQWTATICGEAGVTWRQSSTVERVSRSTTVSRYTFVINHGTEPCEIGEEGTDLITGSQKQPRDSVAGGQVAVVRSASSSV
jgi:beta-galactosidase